ncbi:MAG: mevalonate kinase [Sulfolobales archaeon]|nr:mevalonate kinase [Sulfolobales archaeon]MCX8199431.1 mevalonate kinase [Sulfolobales archaeon]MDW8170254.1 mevalonate kinase [Desulfurococcaceae archaeon]
MKICSTAPGKVILFGEHFVVKGTPAIAGALSLRAKVCIEDCTSGIEVVSMNRGWSMKLGEFEPLQLRQFKRIIEYVVKEGYLSKVRNFRAYIWSKIPIGSGLGSSAATAVAFTTSLLEFHGVSYGANDVKRISLEAEREVHVNPSGIDNAIATYGGLILYRKGAVRRLKAKLPKESLLLIVDTGIERSTGSAVKYVLEMYEKHTSTFKYIYRAASSLINEALKAIREKDLVKLGELMQLNQGLLRTIGVSNLDIENIVYNAVRLGAFGAKITGAGMGGSVIVLTTRENYSTILEGLKPFAKRFIPAKIDPRGYVVSSSYAH